MTPQVIPLADRHFAVEMKHVEAKSGIVVGSERTLVFDAGSDADEGEDIFRLASELAPQPVLLAYSHGHWDHARGGTAFEGLEIVSHRDALQMLEGQLPADRSGYPTRTFSGTLEINLGDISVELRSTPGHAPGAAVLWSPGARILFAGDTVVTSIPPVFRDGDSTELEHTIRSLAELEIDHLVPGHGAVVSGRQHTAEALASIADYIARVRSATLERIADGADVDESLALIDDAEAAMSSIDGPVERTLERHINMYRDIFTELVRKQST